MVSNGIWGISFTKLSELLGNGSMIVEDNCQGVTNKV